MTYSDAHGHARVPSPHDWELGCWGGLGTGVVDGRAIVLIAERPVNADFSS